MKKQSNAIKTLAAVLALTQGLAPVQVTATTKNETRQESNTNRQTQTRDIGFNQAYQYRRNNKGFLNNPYLLDGMVKAPFWEPCLGHPKRHFNKKRHGKKLRRKHARA